MPCCTARPRADETPTAGPEAGVPEAPVKLGATKSLKSDVSNGQVTYRRCSLNGTPEKFYDAQDVLEQHRDSLERTRTGGSKPGRLSSVFSSVLRRHSTTRSTAGERAAADDGPEPTGPVGCFSLKRAEDRTQVEAVLAHALGPTAPLPMAGSSMRTVRAAHGEDGVDVAAGAEAELQQCWCNCHGAAFQLRSQQYMKTRVKEAGGASIYQLAHTDYFHTAKREHNMARRMLVPPAEGPLEVKGFPRWLAVHSQFPFYNPPFFSRGADGVGSSFVLWFALPDGFDPDAYPNQAAISLMRKFFKDEAALDGKPARDRLKLVHRIANLEEFITKASISRAEAGLMRRYNGKPILTRPQHAFKHHADLGILEIEINVHEWAFPARKVFHGFMDRFRHAVLDLAWVVQGDHADELPEVALCAARGFRMRVLDPGTPAAPPDVGGSEGARAHSGSAEDGPNRSTLPDEGDISSRQISLDAAA
ncbi:unnamed protein product [Pedinophyceae sp. YPF-701]|nr:unnamed protein product [Pedinophyceae sp. YPF-701]